MITPRNICLYIAAGLLFALLPMQSMQAQAPQVRSSIEFSCVSWEALPFSELLYREGHSYLPLESRPKVRSQLYPLKGGHEALELYIKGLDEDGQLIYKLVAQAPIAVGTSRMLFFIQESKSAEGLPLNMFGVDDSLAVFPMGSFRFVNTTNVRMQVLFPNTKGALPARGMKVLTPKIPKLGGFIPLYVTDMEKNIVFETRLFGQPRGRKMVFIQAPEKQGGRARVRFLPEIIPQEFPKPEAP
jgi:hypothetical protein